MPVMPELCADTIVYNGTIWCGYEEGTVEALAIWQGKVLATGTKDQIWSLRGDKTRLIDLEGRFATPGLNDAHLHLISVGLTLKWIDATPQAAPTLQSLLDAIREKAASAPPGPGSKHAVMTRRSSTSVVIPISRSSMRSLQTIPSCSYVLVATCRSSTRKPLSWPVWMKTSRYRKAV